MPASNNSFSPREERFGHREALAELHAEFNEAEARRLETERAAWRARCQRASLFVDDRGLALAA